MPSEEAQRNSQSSSAELPDYRLRKQQQQQQRHHQQQQQINNNNNIGQLWFLYFLSSGICSTNFLTASLFSLFYA